MGYGRSYRSFDPEKMKDLTFFQGIQEDWEKMLIQMMHALLKGPYRYLYGNIHWKLGEKAENIHATAAVFRWREGKI